MSVCGSAVRGSVIIFHEQAFVSHSLETLLSCNEFDVLGNFEWIDELDAEELDYAPDLCILGCFEEPGKFETACQMLRRNFPHCRVLVIDAGYSEEAMQAARAQKLSAYLSVQLTPDLILNSIRLVQAGNECYPTGSNDVNHGEFTNGKSQDDDPDNSFTQRESDVLSLVAAGLPNKMIARKLCISESTVKGYMNTLLRKTGTANRTQAACWAVGHGYSLHHESE